MEENHQNVKIKDFNQKQSNFSLRALVETAENEALLDIYLDAPETPMQTPQENNPFNEIETWRENQRLLSLATKRECWERFIFDNLGDEEEAQLMKQLDPFLDPEFQKINDVVFFSKCRACFVDRRKTD